MATVNFIRSTKQSRGALGGVKRYVMQEKKTVWDGYCPQQRCWDC